MPNGVTSTVISAMHFAETRALDNWGVCLLRGEDRYGYNKVVDPPKRRAVATVA